MIDIARSDTVPQPITDLPLLDWVASHTTKSRLSDFAVIVHTHLLPNNLPFFRHLSYLVGFGQIFILEKPYSTVRSAYNELIRSGSEVVQVQMEPGLPYEYSTQKSLEILWRKVVESQKKNKLKNLLIIDDGGDLWLSVPWDLLKGVYIAGVEQTQRGITRIQNSSLRIPPIISVASSGIKKLIESQFIGRSVVNKLKEQDLVSSSKKIGILGMGSIGSAINDYLKELGQKPIYYDSSFSKNNPDDSNAYASIDSLINKSDIIIGTTGTDALKGVAFERISGKKVFTSASSTDIEFYSLLKLADSTSAPFNTRHIKVHDNLTIDILNGGYPINFDREKNATSSSDIVLTRCLMYIAAMQAVELIRNRKLKGKIYNLDPISQKKTLEQWILEKRNAKEIAPVKENEVDKIIHYSSLDKGTEMKSIWQE